MTENKKLFDEFPPIKTKEWEEMIHKAIKGQDYNKTLIWNTIEGLKIKPYYRNEDLKDLKHLKAIPGKYPYTRGNYKNHNWEIEQELIVENINTANEEAQICINNGVTSLLFKFTNSLTSKQLTQLLRNIDTNKIAINFNNSGNYKYLRSIVTDLSNQKGINPNNLKGYLDIDPLAFLMLNGNFPGDLKVIINTITDVINHLLETMPNYRAINIKGDIFHNSGASAVQELAFTLSSANEYLVLLTDKGLDIESVTPKLQFTLSVGSNYFIEIAKLRAARLLWSRIVDQYKPSDTTYNKIHIHSETSLLNKSIYDPYTNILRTTTEAMSAIIGGADSVTIHPFDFSFKNADEFSKRIANNIQNLLKYESHLDKTIDPSAGSYYIEKLTDEIARKSWELFRQIAKEGGFIESARKGIIQKEINQTARDTEERIASGNENILGTSLFPNASEKMLDKIQKVAFEDSGQTINIVQPLKLYRKARSFEELRLKTEKFEKKGNKIPKVFLFPIGNPAISATRSIFSKNFFAVGGFDIQDNHTFESTDQGIRQAIRSDAEIIVICGSDPEYDEYAPKIAERIHEKKPDSKIVITGYPEEIIDKLKKVGIDDFIHTKSNVIDTLTKYQNLFNIK